ncbi:MAG: cytidylate kinase-like family protein [Deltaproteobacteria bacterium]|nr:MAG: cytidylate kinase-like family protein [Deltaproteobacteria bacterium]
MAIITISRGSYSKGKEVAEKVAKCLGYECVSREVLLDASDRFNIPEVRLVRAIHDAPTILERFGRKKQAFLAYIRYSLARRVQQDNVVYHGLAGHLLLSGIPHLLKVRIIASLEDRVKSEMQREGVSEHEARTLIIRDDQERRKWTQALSGLDPWDSALYDLVIHIRELTVDDAVNFICEAAQLAPFETTPEAKQKMDDLVAACELKAALVNEYPDVGVICKYGTVLIYTKSGERVQHKVRDRARKLAQKIDGIHHIEVHAGVTPPPSAV